MKSLILVANLKLYTCRTLFASQILMTYDWLNKPMRKSSLTPAHECTRARKQTNLEFSAHSIANIITSALA